MSLIAHHVSDPVVRAFWQNEYAGYSDSFRGEAVAPIQNKIGKALMVPSLRNMLAQPSSTITFRRLMDEGAIVICNLSKGSLGESTAHLLGALITTALAQAALSRADTSAGNRRVFHLYADEFQSFATESFALILSEARKYALTLTTSLLVEVLPANGEAMCLVCAKGRMRQNHHCTNVQFDQALCLAAASGKITRVFGSAMLARDV